MRKIVPLLLLLSFPACLWAFDFGLALNQELGVTGIEDDSYFDYSASLIPGFSTSLGGSGDLFISAGLTASYENEESAFFLELLHSEISWRFDNLKIRFGRIPYTDPLDFVIDGLFDGAQVLYDTSIGTFNAGAWYTGLLYKERNNITISLEDFVSYYTNLDYDDFPNTYFASRRMIMALGWEHPSLADVIRLRAALSGQLDLNDTDTHYHSMYISAQAAVPVKQFVFQAGVCMQMGQTEDESDIGFAWELGALWALPTPFPSRLSLNGKFTSGKTDDVDAFVPVTTKAQGYVLEAKLSGISVLSLDFTARLHPTFSIDLTNSYFIRSDLGTYNGYPVSGDNSDYFLGTELFGRLVWSPFSDLHLNLGGGAFFPSPSGMEPMWRIQLGLALILY